MSFLFFLLRKGEREEPPFYPRKARFLFFPHCTKLTFLSVQHARLLPLFLPEVRRSEERR